MDSYEWADRCNAGGTIDLMNGSNYSSESPQLGYLCVDRFLTNPLVISALYHCWIKGWIEKWNRDSEVRLDPSLPNATVFLAILQDANVVVQQHSKMALSPEFKQALKYIDLFSAKLEFCHGILSDAQSIGLWLENPMDFQNQSELFRMFDYGRCVDTSPESLQSALRWVRLTTAMSRYEAPLFHETIPWEEHHQWLDLGGNSGEFAIQNCSRFQNLHATIFDLPAVCALGQKHVASYGMSHRIKFHSGDFVNEPLNHQYDLVSFKSVLHDWPEDRVGGLLRNAWANLRVGGRLVIIERAKIPGGRIPLGFGLAPVWMFWNYYRAPEYYEDLARENYQTRAHTQIIHAEMPWMVVQIVKSV